MRSGTARPTTVHAPCGAGHIARMPIGMGRGVIRIEPIAIEDGPPRKPIRSSAGSGKRADEAVMAEPRAHVREEEADGVAVVDDSPSP